MNSVLNYFFKENGFHPFFFFPSIHLVLCHYAFDWLVAGSDCLISFPGLIFVLWLTWLLAKLMCYI
jgi:hypothetical protein